ncbi:metal-sensing transcriptional repressor [Microbacterium halotolerans]|uniref:metal-sensing transcriptional repressor n=1 Tax=Microbacterium halotolerans TaxID=246613 RepID=UPI000E6AB121|nr:metal-sensing transcriptional repressor [Microbacterium halotolerans]
MALLSSRRLTSDSALAQSSRPGRPRSRGLNRVSAMTTTLRSVAVCLFEEHLSRCIVEAAAQGSRETSQKIEEASGSIARLVRS